MIFSTEVITLGRPDTKIQRQCKYCGNEFRVSPSVVERGRGNFCSVSCGTTYRNITNNPTRSNEVRKKISANHADVSGENNPMYGRRGKDAPSYIDGRSSFTGDTYRRILLASGAEQKCSECGSVQNLHAHHANGDHGDNRLENLVWLCVSCHNNIAHKYERDELGRFIGSTLRNH